MSTKLAIIEPSQLKFNFINWLHYCQWRIKKSKKTILYLTQYRWYVIALFVTQKEPMFFGKKKRAIKNHEYQFTKQLVFLITISKNNGNNRKTIAVYGKRMVKYRTDSKTSFKKYSKLKIEV